MSVAYCNNPIGDYVNDDGCGEQFNGGIRHIVVFTGDLPADPSNGTEVNALIADGTAKLIRNVKVGISPPSEITTTSYISCVSDPVVNYDREISLMDSTVTADNVEFYNSINSASGNKASGILMFECDADRCTFVDKDIVFSGGRNVPDQNDDSQRFEFTLRYRATGDGSIVTTPAGVFS